MSNPTMPNMPNFPGMSTVTDTVEFMKNLWGGMGTPVPGFPGMVMPTLSVEEINKQITDLKAVESWLSMNMNMLRATIQALEVQSATIATLQSMGQTLSGAANPNAPAAASAFPFSKPAEAANQEAPKPEAETEADADAKAEAKRKARDDLKAEFKAESKPTTESGSAPAPEPDTGNFAMPGANPALWWNMLQEQFKQAVNTAMPPNASPSASKPATSSSRKRKTPPKS